MIIAFSFLSLLNDDYKSSIVKFNQMSSNDWLHFDVMDAKFVSNYTFDYNLVKEINNYNKLFSDVHLMINDVEDNILNYYKSGANQLTFHYEAIKKEKIKSLIKGIKDLGMKVGISIKPETEVKVLDPYLKDLDYILIMSVEPGKGGQKFIDSSLDKIKYLNKLKSKYHYLIGVDGGINEEISLVLEKYGVDVVVMGTYLANNLNLETINKVKRI